MSETPERMGLDAIRQAIEERDEAVRALAAQEFRGNSVSWWCEKAHAYGAAIDAVWAELRTAGVVCDGTKTSAEGVRELAARSDDALRLIRGRTILAERMDLKIAIDRLRAMGLL